MTSSAILPEIKPDLKVLADLLCAAFEGGSNYWAEIDARASVAPDRFDFLVNGPGSRPYRHIDWPLNAGGVVVVVVDGEERRELTLDKCLAGWQIMRTAQAKHYANVTSDNWDADDADIYLQCCVLGEVIYG